MKNTRDSHRGAAPLRRALMASTTLAVALAFAGTAVMAQDATPAAEEEETQTVIVTGYRASLQSAMNIKKRNDGIVDAIVAEDMAKFPDANLAESIQRIPGVTLTRSDGGEGRNITVRGLNASFTRVRLNGIEGTTATGASDILGSTNRGRAFDFSVFASELFNAIEVRKTSAADVEEGSLGATVDLKTARPFDNRGFHYALSGQVMRNNLEGGSHPRMAAVISNTWGDFGALASVAWSKRSIMEEGYEAVDILAASQDGGFCSPVGYTPQNPADTPAKGSDAANCATGLPRLSTLADYNDVFSRTDVWSGAAGSGAFHPRLPRYRRSLTDYERLGATVALQWRPSDVTKFDLDLMYGKFQNTRHDNYIQVLSHGRNASAGGKPYSSILEAEFEADGSWTYGRFAGVDVRSEGLRDVYTTTFKQASLSGSHEFTDRFRINGLIGINTSLLDEPIRTTVQLDIPNIEFSFDFRQNPNVPLLTFGADVDNPANYRFDDALEIDGTLRGAWNGRFLKTETELKTAELNAEYDLTETFKIKSGFSLRDNNWNNMEGGPAGSSVLTLPVGVTLADVTRSISGFGDGLDGPSGMLDSWLAVDLDKFLVARDLHCLCTTVAGAAPSGPAGVRNIHEKISAAYVMGNFNFDVGFAQVRGDVGVRYVKTEVESTGVAVAGPTRTVVTVPNEYDDVLPSANLTVILPNNIYLRASAAKVLSRPEYTSLAPNSNINTTVQTVGIGNPFLDPIRASTFDLQAEWYFADGGLLSVGYFHKDIDTFIQGYSELVPWNQIGLPDDLLTNGGTCSITGPSLDMPECVSQPTTSFNVSRSVNTEGGPLDGFEISYQQPFTFLPGLLKNTGIIANYTSVKSEIEYITRIDNPTTTPNEELRVTGDFTGLSRKAYNFTLYYEDDRFSARMSANHKGKAINNVLGNVVGHDFIFTDPATYYDVSATYKITPRLNLTVEGQNLTEEVVRFGQDSERNDTRLYVYSGRTLTFGLNYKY